MGERCYELTAKEQSESVARKRKRKKHLGKGVLTTLTSQILAEGGQAASQLGGLRRDEKARQSYEGWVH